MASLCRAPAQEEIESYDDAITGAVPTGTNAASHDFDNDTDDSDSESDVRKGGGGMGGWALAGDAIIVLMCALVSFPLTLPFAFLFATVRRPVR